MTLRYFVVYHIVEENGREKTRKNEPIFGGFFVFPLHIDESVKKKFQISIRKITGLRKNGCLRE